MPKVRAVIAVFLAALAVPLGASVLHVGTRQGASESATEADRPTTWTAWLDYFDAHFGFRRDLIEAHAALMWEVLRESPSGTVIKGRDGWLYYADDSSLDDYESETPLTDDELAQWRDAFVSIRDRMRALGAAYVLVIAPDKHVLYPEHMPASIHRLHSQYRMDQLLDYLRAHSDLAIADLRGPLVARKPVERLYHRTDTHWNDRGAFVGYDTIMRTAGREIPGLAPMPRAGFLPVTTRRNGMDLAEMLSIAPLVQEDSLDLVPRQPRRAQLVEPPDLREGYEVARAVTEIPRTQLPRLVMFRDSFATALIPFLSEHFSRAVYLWQNNVDDSIVVQEKPALVIHEIVGRRFQTLVPESVE
ncbi:MAG TPA: hypothetical protein VG871_24690 [Vicinamibacterales bacterium]|nr:hypothetical protein [Vicinamibacterales bacterium]